MIRARPAPSWQPIVVRVGFGLIIACLVVALAMAPFLLRRNLETVDASALRSEIFALHLSFDEAAAAMRAWDAGEADAGQRLEERSQILAHRIGVILAYPGVRAILPGNAQALSLMQRQLDGRLDRLGDSGLSATDRQEAHVNLARLIGTDGNSFDHYITDAFHQLGRVASRDRSKLEDISVIAQRFSAVLVAIALLTLGTMMLQRRELRETGLTLRSAVNDLAEAHRIAHIGIVRWDFQADEVTWSDEFARIYGLEPGGRMSGTAFQDLLLPADVEKVVTSEKIALERSALSGKPELREVSYRARRSDGEVIELEALSELSADTAGNPLLMVSTVRDITEEARAKRALRDSERSLSAAQRIAHLGSFRRNLRTGRAHWSHEMFRMLDFDPAAGPVPMQHLIHPEDLPRIEALHMQLSQPGPAGGQRQAQLDCRMRKGDGSICHMRGTAEMTYDEQGQPESLTGTLRDVTGEIAQETALREALGTAEQANTAKSEFLAIMSHELRTPMNGVLGMLGALDETPLSPEQHGQLRIARTSANALLVILNDILDMSKIEAGKMELEVAPFDLRPMVRSVIHLYAQRAREKGILLDSEIGHDVPAWLLADSGRVRQILVNLVSNAIKFTQAGSVIVSVTRQGEAPDGRIRLRFAVTDTGMGIPPEKQPEVFGRFNQLDASYTRRFGGTGLGLSICRSLAELMDGDMSFTSRYGAGSAFFLDVPLAAAAAGSETELREEELDLPRMRILVAEDNSTNQIVARSMLERLGQNPDFVMNGQEAIEAVERFRYDMILMDVSMPVLDGLEATRRIRAMPEDRGQLPIIALTAHAGANERRACLEAGFNEVLTKPLLRPRLQAALARWKGESVSRHAEPAPATPARDSAPNAAQSATPSAAPKSAPPPTAGTAPDAARAPAAAMPVSGTPFAEDAVLRAHVQELCLDFGDDAVPALLGAGISDLTRHYGVLDGFRNGTDTPRLVVERSFHSLVGVASTLGCPGIAAQARVFESRAADLPADSPELGLFLDQLTQFRVALDLCLKDLDERLGAMSPGERA